MKLPLIRQGEGPAGFHRIHTERERERRNLERTIALPPPDLDSHRRSRATAAGDSTKLRGIPAIGRGVNGASPGTQPEQAIR